MAAPRRGNAPYYISDALTAHGQLPESDLMDGAMVSFYKPNPQFELTFRRSDEARAYALGKAEATAGIARRNAPVASGEYRASITADVEETPDGWVGLVIAGASHSVNVEFGTEDTPTFATLRRAGETIERM